MNLYKLRNEKGVTQKELASVLGVTIRTITNYENGSREPNIATLLALADYFDVSLDYLVGRTNNPDVNANPSERS